MQVHVHACMHAFFSGFMHHYRHQISWLICAKSAFLASIGHTHVRKPKRDLSAPGYGCAVVTVVEAELDACWRVGGIEQTPLRLGGGHSGKRVVGQCVEKAVSVNEVLAHHALVKGAEVVISVLFLVVSAYVELIAVLVSVCAYVLHVLWVAVHAI